MAALSMHSVEVRTPMVVKLEGELLGDGLTLAYLGWALLAWFGSIFIFVVCLVFMQEVVERISHRRSAAPLHGQGRRGG